VNIVIQPLLGLGNLCSQVTEIQQRLDDNVHKNLKRLDDNERETRKQIDGLLSLLVESGAQAIESCSDLPIPNLKYLINILCRRLDTLSLSDGGNDRKPSYAQSVGTCPVEAENASKDTLVKCIQHLFSECAQAEGGDDQDAAGQCATTTARAQTSGAADNSSGLQGSQDDAASSTSRKRSRVSVKQRQM
jgi:hypothetical protein